MIDEDEFPEDSAPEDPLTGDQVLALRTEPVSCAPTEFAPIDQRLRGGGLPRGLLACFTGAPESGKTRLLCQTALGLSKTMPVIMLLTDWGRSAAMDIMAVMEGFDPAKIDDDPQGAREWWRLRTKGRLLFFLNDNASLVEAFDRADTLGHCAVLLDSIQTISPIGVRGFEKATGYEKNRVLVRYIRQRLRPTGRRSQAHTCIFTSESNRASYAAKSKDDRSTDISSPLGGGIDYAADFLIAIHRPEGDADQRTLVFAKNRYRPFLNRLPRSITADYDPAGLMIEVSPEEAAKAEKSAYEATLIPMKRVLRTVLEPGPQPSFRRFRDAVQSLDPSISNEKFAKVLKVMVSIDHSIQEGDGPNKAITYSLAYSE